MLDELASFAEFEDRSRTPTDPTRAWAKALLYHGHQRCPMIPRPGRLPRQRRTGAKWQSLCEPEREPELRVLAGWASRFSALATDRGAGIHKLAPGLVEKLLDDVMWFWTADAFDPSTGMVVRDAIKHDFAHQRWTDDAWNSRLSRPRPLQHEHAVPKKKLKTLIMGRGPDETFDVLSKLAHAVIVTKTEHQKFNERGLKDTMPDDWDGLDPFARYSSIDLRFNLPKTSTK